MQPSPPLHEMPRGGPDAKESVTKYHSYRKRYEYAQAVLLYSRLSMTQSLYAGVHFEPLARYLQQPYEARAGARAPDRTSSAEAKHGTELRDPEFSFVTFYNLDPLTAEREAHIDSPKLFERKAKELTESEHGRLVFMRGQPSPEWLLAIGATYQVDPEFFRRHLNFRHGLRDHYSLPSLPSTSHTALTLRVNTICASIAKVQVESEQVTIEELREQNKLRIHNYREELKSLMQMNLGDSVVRDSSIHDLQQFSIEQDFSLYVGTCGMGWFALVWLDVASTMKDSATSFLSNSLGTKSWTISSVPVIQHCPGLALRRAPKLQANMTKVTKLNNASPPGILVQNASQLHLGYGLDLDKTLAAANSFYALHEIMIFTSCAENQFLNMLETNLLIELDPALLIHQKEPTLSNLLYNQQILDRHIQRIGDNLDIFKTRGSLGWPHKTLEPERQEIIDKATENLIKDYEYLLSRALTLSEKCSRGMKVVMNNAMVKESRDAIYQAEGVAKLTRLAFVFVPLSFTASFFGMNFAQFGQGNLNLWIWFAASAPIFIGSLFFMNYDLAGKITRTLRKGNMAVRTRSSKDVEHGS